MHLHAHTNALDNLSAFMKRIFHLSTEFFT